LHTDKAPVSFFICSDGIDDNYPADEKENAEHLYRLYREVAVTFAEDGYESTCGKDGNSGQIKDLATGFATKGKGDDTSLAGIVNLEKLKEAAPQWKARMAADDDQRAKAKAEAKEKAEAERKAADEAEAKKAARRKEREAERAAAETAEKDKGKPQTDAGENIETYGEFSANAKKAPEESEDAKSKAELLQDAKNAINEAAKKIDRLA
jgi:Skp family chaperone for outer membrane proteins